MQINGPPSSPSSAASATESSATAARPWQVGDKLLATVLRLVDQGAVLAVGRQQLLARTNAPLQAGQNLKLEVVQPRSEPPQLRILNEGGTQNHVEQTLRVLLPRQSSLTPLLANLALLGRAIPTANTTTGNSTASPGTGAPSGSAQGSTLNPGTGNAAGSLPRPVTEQLQQWLRLLPDVAQASRPEGLKQALQDSGVFLEARLARLLSAAAPGTTPSQATAQLLGQDLRAGLLRLAAALQQLRPAPPPSGAPPGAPVQTASAGTAGGQTPAVQPAPAPPPPLRGVPPLPQANAPASLAGLPPAEAGRELLQQVEGALARIQLHQLQSLPSSEAGRAVWAMELPLRHGQDIDLFGLRIERDAEHNPAAPTQRDTWSVSLAFDLGELGPVRARISLYDGQISAQFWTEQSATRQRFEDHLATLHARLRDAGLQVGRLGCHSGMPPDASPPPPSGLVNEKA